MREIKINMDTNLTKNTLKEKISKGLDIISNIFSNNVISTISYYEDAISLRNKAYLVRVAKVYFVDNSMLWISNYNIKCNSYEDNTFNVYYCDKSGKWKVIPILHTNSEVSELNNLMAMLKNIYTKTLQSVDKEVASEYCIKIENKPDTLPIVVENKRGGRKRVEK